MPRRRVIPNAYHEFFSDAAEVAGALIGLLFVAVSVAPERLHASTIDFRVRAGIAFAALTNCLLTTLVATLPGHNLASAGIVFGAGGLLSCGWLAWTGARHEQMGRRASALVRVTWLGAIFAVQLIACIRLHDRPHGSGPVGTIAYLVLGSFAVAIERSWELVGGTGTSVLAQIERASLALRPSDRRADPDSDAPEAESTSAATDDP